MWGAAATALGHGGMLPAMCPNYLPRRLPEETGIAVIAGNSFGYLGEGLPALQQRRRARRARRGRPSGCAPCWPAVNRSRTYTPAFSSTKGVPRMTHILLSRAPRPSATTPITRRCRREARSYAFPCGGNWDIGSFPKPSAHRPGKREAAPVDARNQGASTSPVSPPAFVAAGLASQRDHQRGVVGCAARPGAEVRFHSRRQPPLPGRPPTPAALVARGTGGARQPSARGRHSRRA